MTSLDELATRVAALEERLGVESGLHAPHSRRPQVNTPRANQQTSCHSRLLVTTKSSFRVPQSIDKDP